MDEISAGGVVIEKDNVLVLKKFRGDWVLPKGRLEDNESIEQAAVREVYEETGIHASITRYIGFVKYVYAHIEGYKVNKTVHYYLMSANDEDTTPQREEGFSEAVFMNRNKAIQLLKHEAEKNMVRRSKKKRKR